MPTTPDQTFPAVVLDRLRTLTGDRSAEFRDGQLEAIRDVVVDRARVLCVQRTGWGKSAVYFVATGLLREAGAGPALIVSPLLALMRNQIAAAGRLGLRAHTINSTNREEWDDIRDRLAGDAIDLLLISPERLNNPRFREEMLPLFAASVGLLVIDEAHCISDWGHDFRPDYRRVKDMLDALAPGVAVLGTTATANDRVVGDVVSQLAAGVDEPLRSYRGPLARASLRLEVLELPQPAQRLAWLASSLPQLPGSGIVYTLTKRDAEQVASWLSGRGIAAVPYSGEHETVTRVDIEDRLLRNEIKAVVATSALGMGYDKPDLSFVVHYQAPGSVIAYYQQIGRAGRGVEHADIVLLRGGEDRRIQDFFIEQAFPAREHVKAVLDDLRDAGEDGRTTREVMATVNLGMGRIESMLKVLDVEGAVTRSSGNRWLAVPGADWRYEFEDEVVAALGDLLRTTGAEWLTSVPSVRLGDALERLGRRLGVTFLPLIERVAERPPQRDMANATQQAANVRGAFRVVSAPPPGTGALLDDRRLSGWTMAMVGGQLRRAGALRVVPVALATLA